MKGLSFLLVTVAFLAIGTVKATIVEVQTTQGNFQLNLFDTTTPNTVENFLQYVDDELYNGVVFHRMVTDFVLQGGGYTYDSGTFLPIENKGPVLNEPFYSNVRGTVAMAKLANDPNSATNQWFINLSDNSANLDVQNGGFTVFGQVIGDGMLVVDKISEYQCDDVPLVDTTDEQCDDLLNDNSTLSAQQLITINYVAVIDNNVDTAYNLSPAENSLLQQNSIESAITVSSDSSGSIGSLAFFLTSLIFWRRFIVLTA